ncbi:uncharacterized protein TRIADDRAFT_21945 [Trichoplax adhaerens]|uniref:Uncharacterized protein n=1 Tax=Trichoplax adhaerens TaxID=10228 RepID=B3RRA6_TRIAD|nr:hypothetical protein TRIADDRAFT_21945 [Trichoplax adhaerens]EDV26310.1 hypothetical protein TRIADDRAFT_21945 [Trichoplax adhaerens]|eukprot:XP_002110306.1 hypothetical protein TRIADDRAFT_21945 [Trichoplax adhaerens]
MNSSDQQVDGNCLNIDAWISHHKLYVGQISCDIILNPAEVSALSLPRIIMTQCTIYPEIRLESCQIHQCQFTWYRSRHHHNQGKRQWIKVSDQYSYMPTSNDIDCYLKVSCKLPQQNTSEVEVISENPVMTGPSCHLLQQRFHYTETATTNKEIRTVSYNILGESYVGSKYAKRIYRNCPDYALDINYRQQLLMRELTSYNADLICLQEVSHETFNNRLKYGLQFQGFQGLWKSRVFDNNDGLAIFYKTSKFDLISQHDLDLNASIQKDSYQEALLNLIRPYDQLVHEVLSRSNVLQVALLRRKECNDQLICLANTHLYFRPLAEIIRLIQIQAITNHLSLISKSISDLPVILCGDFNSAPSSDTYQFLTNGYCKSQSTADESYLLKDAASFEFSHNLTFDALSQTLHCTHHTTNFSGTIDYIFGKRGYFNVKNAIPLLEVTNINANHGLPTTEFPSDHLAVICDISMVHHHQ